MKRHLHLMAAVTATGLLIAGCGDAPEESADTTPPADETTDVGDATTPAGTGEATTDTDTPTGGTDTPTTGTDTPTTEPTADPTAAEVSFDGSGYSACQVTDTGGVDDRSFNQTAYKGMLDAEEMGVDIFLLESTNAADYEPNINTFLDQDCDIIITAGFAIGEATAAAAEANPDVPFAIVDFDFTTEDDEDVAYDNVRELMYQTDEAAFLAGYLAAGMTETGTIATYGGLPFPTVTIFMDGFLAGAMHYNEVHSAEVEVLGWDGNPDTGVFVNTFDEESAGRTQGDAFLAQGADIIMPVAGPVGAGTGAAIREAGTGMLIWVDTDGFETFPEYGDILLTSVEKKMDMNVLESIGMVIDDNFQPGLYTGTLENGGVDISPFHDFEDAVPQELKDELTELRQAIIDGTQPVTSDVG